jgi:RNA polymerase sigma-70 factor (ECF subfamily)
MTHTEIARKTGEPLGTVKTRIRSALLAVRKAFS